MQRSGWEWGKSTTRKSSSRCITKGSLQLFKSIQQSASDNVSNIQGLLRQPKTVHPEEEVAYSTVFTKTRSSSHRMNSPQSQPSENPADEVMYCSVILQNPQAIRPPNQPAADSASDGIYSLAGPQKT